MTAQRLEPGKRAGRLLDLSDTMWRLLRKTPTGIGRVELAYARYYLEHASERVLRCQLTTPLNSGLLSRSLAGRVVRTALDRYSESARQPASDPAFDELSAVLRAPVRPAQLHCNISAVKPPDAAGDAYAAAVQAAAYVQVTVRGAVNPWMNRVPAEAYWYLQVSQCNLPYAARFAWLRRAGLRKMFMVHDLISVTNPEYCDPEQVDNWRGFETVARCADVVIFNSKATQAAWDAYIEESDLPRPRGEVVPLGVEAAFVDGRNGQRLETETPYFVIVGTFVRRKNLAFLLEVWKRWTQEGRLPRARLVVVGRRGSKKRALFDMLDRSKALAPTVVEISDLSDAGLSALLRGARALLAPSLLEGFGLPVAEALALGVPVIASDIAAHREVGGAFAEYVEPTDGPGWMAMLDEYVNPVSARREMMRTRAAKFRPITWADHMTAVEAILARSA